MKKLTFALAFVLAAGTACESLLPAVTETMLDLISRVEPVYHVCIRQNVILSSGTGLIRGFGVALQNALDEIGGGVSVAQNATDNLYVVAVDEQ
jgi:hypothetical protein